MLKKILAFFGFRLWRRHSCFRSVDGPQCQHDSHQSQDSPATFRSNHFTFDLAGTTGTGAGLDRLGNFGLHPCQAPARSGTRATTLAGLRARRPIQTPSCYVHNLQSPGLANNATNRANTLSYDTFFTSPGSAFTVDPTFASPRRSVG